MLTWAHSKNGVGRGEVKDPLVGIAACLMKDDLVAVAESGQYQLGASVGLFYGPHFIVSDRPNPSSYLGLIPSAPSGGEPVACER
jgi:hypothetical protein